MSGTNFEDSPLRYGKRLPNVWFIVNARNAISSCELARNLDTTHKSAWHMAQRTKTASKSKTFQKPEGEVELNQTLLGQKFKNISLAKRKALRVRGIGRGSPTRTRERATVQGILERREGGRLSAEVLPDT